LKDFFEDPKLNADFTVDRFANLLYTCDKELKSKKTALSSGLFEKINITGTLDFYRLLANMLTAVGR